MVFHLSKTVFPADKKEASWSFITKPWSHIMSYLLVKAVTDLLDPRSGKEFVAMYNEKMRERERLEISVPK